MDAEKRRRVQRGVEAGVGAAIIDSLDAIDSPAAMDSPEAINSPAGLGEPQVPGDRFCHLFV
jgi:hypothetical protein